MTLTEIQAFLTKEFPQVFADDLLVRGAADGEAVLVLKPDEKHLRPGAIVSGPTLMMLADAAAYAALMSLSEDAKRAVTSNLNISFLRAAPPDSDVVQSAKVVKAGRRLSVIVCEAATEAGVELAHATLTYAMPSESV